MDNILGTIGIKGELPTVGVGFVVIPPGIDKEVFKRDCYISNTLSIAGLDFGHLHNVKTDEDVMQKISFPPEVGEMGSTVVFVTVEKHNSPIIVACLKDEKDVFSTHENKLRKSKSNGEKIVDMDMDAEDAKFSVSVSGDENTPAIIEFLAKGNHKSNYVRIEVDGMTYIKSSSKILMISEACQEIVVMNNKGIVTGKLSLSAQDKQRLFYEDEYKNLISISEEKMVFRADKSKKVQFGDGKEDLALAETLIDKLEKYDQALSKMTVPTAFGPSGTRLNAPEFTAVIKSLKEIRSKLIKSD